MLGEKSKAEERVRRPLADQALLILGPPTQRVLFSGRTSISSMMEIPLASGH